MKTLSTVISTLAAAAIGSTLLVGSVSVAQAADTQTITVAEAQINRSEARKIVRKHLKSQGKRTLKVGGARMQSGSWVIEVLTMQGVPVTPYTVNANTGEIGRKNA